MELPVDTQLRWILRHTALLLELGAEPVRGLILPDGNFFPDRFDGKPAAVAALLARLLDHAGLGHLDARISVVLPDGEQEGGSCSSGACGPGGKIDARLDRVLSLGDGAYAVSIPVGEIAHPVILTTGLVRAVAFMFLNEAAGYDEVRPQDREPLTDLAATLLGFGVLATNGAYVYMKSCGGARAHAATRMKVEELAVALAVFCELHALDARAAARCLDPTQRDIFDEAVAWARSNAGLVRLLRANRRAIDEDAYKLSPARGWLSRTLGIGKKKRVTPDEDVDELERALAEAAPRSSGSARAIDPKKQARLAEIRALVEDSLEG